jgi:LPXTG-motif cell wall-anchored protein
MSEHPKKTGSEKSTYILIATALIVVLAIYFLK